MKTDRYSTRTTKWLYQDIARPIANVYYSGTARSFLIPRAVISEDKGSLVLIGRAYNQSERLNV